MTKWEIAKNSILEYIDNYKLKPGDELPSDREFKEMFGCSLQPVIRAMGFLADRGQIQRRAGAKTTFLDRQPLLADIQTYSFSFKATEVYGCKLQTKLLEISCRLPQASEEVDERATHKALGLKRNQPFYVISRLRYLDGEPRAIHRSYLNPDHFPSTFLTAHEFDRVSLIGLFDHYGYQIESRETKLRARFPTNAEKGWLQINQEPVLSAEQILTARPSDGEQPVILEAMYACYVKWEYVISNR